MIATEKLACAPQIGDYYIIADILLQRCLKYKTMRCPPLTKRTYEIGARYSPDMICTPFKTTLGNFIEAAQQGANVFVMPGVGCRLGFYDILQKQILDDLGYNCEMITLFDYIPTVKRMFTSFKEINPDLTQEEFDSIFEIVVKITVDMDNLADFMRRNMAFELNKGEYEKHYSGYLQEVKNAQSVAEAKAIGIKYKEKMDSVAINKPEKPIRIGIIGEIYIVVEPFSNCNMEKWLAEHDVEIIRPFDLSRMAVSIFTVKEQIEKSGGYVDYNIGSTANDAIAEAYQMIQDGIDGIIHVKPSSCSPEITAMSILQNMSRDYSIPFMYMTFDTETSEAGVHTRLEAFHDMIVMKRGQQA
jgi:predicted nucleotide-binding protein (sugar kinase/HSP70/actin superfamily)